MRIGKANKLDQEKIKKKKKVDRENLFVTIFNKSIQRKYSE